MAISVVATSSAVSNGVASASQITLTGLAFPAGTAVGDRVFVFCTYRGGSAFPPNGSSRWKNAYTYVYPGLNTQLAAAGPRMQSVWYCDYTGGTMGDITIGADFNGQTAGTAIAVTLRKGATEEWTHPEATLANDNTAASPHATTSPTFPVRPGSLIFLHDAWPADPGTVTTPTLTGTSVTSGTITARGAKHGTTLGDDVYAAVFSAMPTATPAGGVAALTRSGAISTARTGHTVFVHQALAEVIDKPVVERVTALENKFDPRTGNTGTWLGADVASDVAIPDTSNKLWIFGDTFWRTASTPAPTSRSGYQFTHSSFALQQGDDLATSTLTFHRAPGGGDWCPPTGTHYFWIQDGLFYNNDLYLMCQRVLASNPLGAEYGWALFRIANAATTPITSWPVATKLYESGDGGTRPLWSPYDGGDGFIYAFAISRGGTVNAPPGWRWCRWPYADFTSGNVGDGGGLRYVTTTGWSSWDQDSICIAENPHTSEGSVNRRPSDGRWIMGEHTATKTGFGGAENRLSVRVSNLAAAPGGVLQPSSGATTGFYPVPTELDMRIGDYILDTTNSNTPMLIRHVNSNGTRVVQSLTETAPVYKSLTTAQMIKVSRSNRYVYDDPRFSTTTFTDKDMSVYAMKAHPNLADADGLLLTYVDNTDSTDIVNDLSQYWPKFVRVRKPVISAFNFNTSTGVATWTVTGAPDRQFYRTTPGGSWTEIGALVRTVTVAPGNFFELLTRGLGGDTTTRTAIAYSNTVGSTAAATDSISDTLAKDGIVDVAAATDAISDTMTMARTEGSAAALTDAIELARGELLSDLAAGVDAASVSAGLDRAVASLANAVDAILADLQKGQEAADVAAALDGVSLARGRFLADVAAAIDNATAGVSRPRSGASTAAAVDAAQAVLARAMADFPVSFAGIVDEIAAQLGMEVNVADSMSAEDAATVRLDHTEIASSSAGAVDGSSATQDAARDLADLAAAFDSSSSQQDHGELPSDGAAATDGTSTAADRPRSAADVAAAVDTANRVVQAARGAADAAAGSDSLAQQRAVDRQPADLAAATDATTVEQAMVQTVNDFVAAVDIILAQLVQAGAATLADSSSATDAATPVMAADRGAADTAPALDQATAGLGFNRSAADSGAAVDGSTLAKTVARSPADVAAGTDAISLARAEIEQDAAAAADSIQVSMARMSYVSETIPLGDATAVDQEFIRIAESFGEIIDSAGQSQGLIRQVDEVITLEDFFSESLAEDPLGKLRQILDHITGEFPSDGVIVGVFADHAVVAAFESDGQGTASFDYDGTLPGIFETDGSTSAAFDHDGVADTAFDHDGVVGVGSFGE